MIQFRPMRAKYIVTIPYDRFGDRVTWGEAVVERFGGEKLAPPAKAALSAFAKRTAQLKAGVKAADAAEATFAEFLSVVASEDGKLDVLVTRLADTMPAERLGTRKNPFEGFASHAPGKLIELGYAQEARMVRGLVASLKKAKKKNKIGPKTPFAKALADVSRQVALVEPALSKLTKPLKAA